MPETPTAAAAALDALADRFWQFQRREFPMNALLAGEPCDDPTMFREAPEDAERRADWAGAQRAELAAVPIDGLDAQRRITHRLLDRELDDLVQQAATLSHLRPWLLPVGPEFNTIYLANVTQLADAAAAQAWAARLATLPAYLDDTVRSLGEGRARGLRHPRVVLEGARANLGPVLGGPAADSPWMAPFRRSPAAGSPAVQAAAAQALRTVEGALRPALQRLADCLQHELLPAARETVACSDDLLGAAAYAHWTRHFTTDPTLAPDAVHALGLSEVARLEGELAAVAAEAGYAGDLPGYRAFLAQDPRFIAPSAQALREQAEVIAKRIDGLLPSWFGRLPRISYGVQSIPAALSARMPPAYAQPSPADRSSAGVYWISSQPDKAPAYLHVALALHEAWPGHLMHIALMQETEALPAFRRANFTKYSAFVEGWALYCETLGVEMGVYRDVHDHYGRLDMELWRACRLVVDTGLHAHGWSREEAIDYMAARLTLSRPTIEAEVDRYIAMPAQALGYQVGNLRMRAVRRRAEQRLGDRFELRAFHDAILGAGPLTLPVLDSVIDDWIDARSH
jgi:uncharacterized protein (DUF885 family)